MKILVADAETITRAALTATLLETFPGARVVEASTLAEGHCCLGASSGFKVAVVDLALPDAHDLIALETIRWSHAEVPVIVLSSREELGTLRRVVEAGARGFVSKRSKLDACAAAVRFVVAGGSFAYVPGTSLGSGHLQRNPFAGRGGGGARASRTLRLTPRQREVLQLLSEGHSNKIICRKLGLAENTVKAHTTAIYRELGVANRTQALAALVRLGLITSLRAPERVGGMAMGAVQAPQRLGT